MNAESDRLDDGENENLLLLFPGFMVAASAYEPFASRIRNDRIDVNVVDPDGRRAARLFGRVSIEHDVDLLTEVAERHASPSTRVWVGGHSRGGGVAWEAARLAERSGRAVHGVVLLDPVWGNGGPRAIPPPLTTAPTCTTLIIGFGVSGQCAPPGRNHEVFAAAAPSAEHVIAVGCGHGDILDPTRSRLAKKLCKGGTNPDASRSQVAQTVVDFIWAHH